MRLTKLRSSSLVLKESEEQYVILTHQTSRKVLEKNLQFMPDFFHSVFNGWPFHNIREQCLYNKCTIQNTKSPEVLLEHIQSKKINEN